MNDQPTPEQRRAGMFEAIRDPETPRVLKRYFKQQVFGYEVHRSSASTLHQAPAGCAIRSRKPKKPQGISGRQWRQARKILRREGE